MMRSCDVATVWMPIPDACWSEDNGWRNEAGESAVQVWQREKAVFLERWVLHQKLLYELEVAEQLCSYWQNKIEDCIANQQKKSGYIKEIREREAADNLRHTRARGKYDLSSILVYKEQKRRLIWLENDYRRVLQKYQDYRDAKLAKVGLFSEESLLME